MIGLIILGVVLVLLLVVLATAVRIVREYQRLVVFRLGRVIGTKGPGIVLLIPLVDRANTRGPSRALPGDPSPDRDHEGQRVDLDRLHHLLQGRRRRRCRC